MSELKFSYAFGVIYLENRMNYKNILLVVLLLSVVACDNSSTLEELEAAQSGVNVVDDNSLEALYRRPLTEDVAQKMCGFQLSQTFGGDPNSSEVKQFCSCIVSKVALSEIIKANEIELAKGVPPINRHGVLEANKAITNQCLGG